MTQIPADTLSAAGKRALLAQMLQEKASKKSYPLSFAQRRFWFFDQFDPGDPSLNILYAIRFSGPINLAALEKSANEILRRHAILRARIVVQDDQPVQIIAPLQPLSIEVVDRQSVPSAEWDAEVQRLTLAEAHTRFDLAAGPLLRIRLIRFSPTEHVGFINMHHTITDGVSMELFTRELGILYAAFTANQASPLPDLPLQYVDFAHRQRQQWQNGQMADQLTYWKKQLEGDLPILDLPTDRPRPPFRTSNGATKYFYLSPQLTEAVKRVSRQEGCTPFVTLLAAFKTLLHRYTGQPDILVGTPVAGRTLPADQNLIGLFTNTLALRTQIDKTFTFRQLLQHVRETTLAALANQEFPFEQLVDELQVNRDPSRPPVFQVMFISRTARPKAQKIAGLTLHALETDTGAALVDLSLVTWETEAGQLVAFEYNTDLFDESTIDRLFVHYQNLLQGAITDPQRSLLRLPMLTPAEQHQLLWEWNDTDAEYDRDVCVHQLFEQAAARAPQRTAVVWGEQRWTYAELNERANQLAHYLRRLGVGPEAPVGIHVERSLEMILAVLAVLKAGGAYVPLDPIHPPDRLAFICQDAGIAVLLTQAHLVGKLSLPPAAEGGPLPTLRLDADWPQIAQESCQNPPNCSRPEHLVYVVYTSGSTGQPKGVMLEHGNLRHAYHGWQQLYQLGQQPLRHLQMASFSFDVFSGDLTRALCSGDTLVLCPRETLLQPDKLAQLIVTENITAAEFVPAVLRLLLDHLEKHGGDLRRFHFLSVGSDAWHVRDHRRTQQLCGPHTIFANTYGVTEATIDSSYFYHPTHAFSDDQITPIGRPYPNVRLYILDDYLQPVPAGVAGELHIGGAGVGRGYTNRPDLTDARFIPNPFRPGERLYKTGDLARFLPANNHSSLDGHVAFLGRADFQVKIRGFRVELGEIEAALQQHEKVQTAAVVDFQSETGDKRLVAYIVPASGTPASGALAASAAPATDELFAFLQERLPDYMLPGHYVILDRLPLSPNGKVNRRQLPIPDLSSRPQVAQPYVAPRTLAEEVLAELFGKVLGLERVGIHDNFFELGGHSLLATQLAIRARDAFQIELPLRAFFETPSIAGLAVAVEEALIEKLETLSEEEAALLLSA